MNSKIMKNLSVGIVLLLLLSAASCETKKEKEEALLKMSKEDSLELVINQIRNETDDLNNMKLKLTDILRQINEAEGRITSVSPEASEQQVIIENMAFIQQKMSEYRKTVAEMQQLLKNANQISAKAKKGYESDIASFTKTLEGKNQEIDSLRMRIAERDLIIAEQGETILEQGQTVNQLSEENAAKEQALIKQDKELHTAWYVFGTKKELEEQHILVKNKVMQSKSVNKNYFTEIDIRVTKTIPLYSKRVKLLTNHPADSYSLDKDANELYTLRIQHPDKFWSVSRYLVISVK